MARLTKVQAKAHAEAVALLSKPALCLEEREFVFDNWQESANHVNSAAAAFFTPLDLAFHLAIETSGCRTFIDLCAGIGALAYATLQHNHHAGVDRMVCVEVNPDYVAVGRKLVPEAEWIVANVESLPDLGLFDMALSNPPFGKVCKIRGPRYSTEADLAVIDIASGLAMYGTFIMPQMSLPFEYSGVAHHRIRPSAKFDKFNKATGIELHAGCGVDCSIFRDQWRGVAPNVEIACADFEAVRTAKASACADLFTEAA